jgi:CubicO group peptidase (beta-lactamase class C family)
MTRTALALAWLLSLASIASAQEAGPASPAGRAAAADEYLSRLAALGFSGAVLVAIDGEVALEQGYGTADPEAGTPWTATTVSSMGSITKPLTATAILELVERGALSLDDSLPRFFAGVPPDKSAITVHHLLTHTAGLAGSLGRDFEPIERDDFVRLALDTPLERAPGERYEYSNVGYSMLGIVIEIVTGRGYEEFVREAVLDPAGMTDTGYRRPAWEPGRVAVGYEGGERWGTVLERPWASDGPGWHLRANGGVHTTVGDLWRWHRALVENRVLDAATRAAMESPQVPEDPEGSSHYGYGWAIFETPRQTKLVGHNGGNGILFAEFLRYVDEDVVVIALSSVAEWSAIPVAARVAAIVFGREVAIPPEVVALEPAALEALAGTYGAEGAELEVGVAPGGALSLEPRGAGAFALLSGADPDGLSAERTERVRAALEAGDSGDWEPLAALFGGGMAAGEVGAQEEDLRRRMIVDTGPRLEIRVLGTAPIGGRPATVVEYVHERGSWFVRFVWGGPDLAGVRVGPEPPGWKLWPESRESFFAFDLREGPGPRVRFEEGVLVIEMDSEEVRARRAAP